ncbi:Heterogeneous nuclear ribonucleoprotein L, partial [Trachymyrmex septentrionalis]
IITFDSIESATRAKETLHGADIYSGCCTLKIDFAKRKAIAGISRARYKPYKQNFSRNDNRAGHSRNSPQLRHGLDVLSPADIIDGVAFRLHEISEPLEMDFRTD